MDINEARKSQSQQAAAIGAGLEQLDLSQEITFQKYSRIVLPLDGYIFWQPTTTLTVTGALHYAQDIIQEEDETLGLASVSFSTQKPIADFTDMPIDAIYVATFNGVRFAFSRQGGFFQPAALWHYQGHSIYPAMASQLLDTPGVLDPSRVVVSNSLPIWLAMNGYRSVLTGGFSNGLTLYPSKAVPANLPPPYGSVHIGDGDTRALQSVPRIQMVNVQLTSPVVDQDGNPVVDQSGVQIVIPVFAHPGGLIPLLDARGKPILDQRGRQVLVPSQTTDSYPVTVPKRIISQLMADRVRIVLYGLQNDEALEFVAGVMEFMNLYGTLGLMNMPAVRDGKRQQVEIQALAMQKIIDFECSYNQGSARDVAIGLIQSACVQVLTANG